MVRPWRRKNCGRKITKVKTSVLIVISTQLPTTIRCRSGGPSKPLPGGGAGGAGGAGGCGGGGGGGGRGRGWWRERRAGGHFLFDRKHQRLGLGRPALRFEPARGLGQALAQGPDHERPAPR